MFQALLGISAFAAVALSTSGCGGSSSDSSTGGGGGGGFSTFVKTPVVAQLELPTGTKSEAFDKLKFWTSGGEVAVDSTGKGEVVIFNDGPQYTQTADSQGRLVAIGFLGRGKTKLSADSTAEALTFFAVGGPLQKGSSSSMTVLNGVKAMPGYAAVVAAVSTSLTTQGFVSADDAAVRTALDNVVNSVTNTGKGRGPDISPTTNASGLNLNDDVDDQVEVTNNHFRRSYAYLEMTGFKDQDGNVVNLQKDLGESWIRMPHRYSGSVDSATGLLTGQYPWQPIASDPFKVPAAIAESDREVEVYYKLTTVGAGRTAGDFADLTNAQFVKWEETVFWTIYLDFFVPIYANLVVPLDGEALDSFVDYALEHPKTGQMITSLRSLMPGVTSLVAQGRFPAAVAGFVSSSHLKPTILPATADVFTAWAQDKGGSHFTGNTDIINRVGVITERIGMINLAAATEELAPMADLKRSDLANIFEITSTRATVSLIPDRTEVGLSGTTDINAVIRNKKEGANYVYEWSVSSSDVFVQDVDGGSTDESPGGLLKSSRSEVFIGNLTNKEITVAVNCRVTLDGKEVGKANTRIQFKNNIAKGTGTFKTVGEIIVPQNGGLYGTYTLALIEIPKIENASRISLVISDKDGGTIKSATWAADKEPTNLYDSSLWAMKPDDTYWYAFDAINTARISGAEAAEEALQENHRVLNNRYIDVKITVTAYLD